MNVPTGELVQTGDFRTHYLEEGSGDPVILIHGGGAGADGWSNWRDCLPLFAKRRRTFAVDLVGFGRSDKPDPASFEYTQPGRNAQLIAFIEAMGLERVSIVGNSMGGATALGVAMARPDLVENLVLMGSAGAPTAAPLSPALAPLMQYDFTVEGMQKIIDVLANPDYQASDEQVRYRHALSAQPDTRAAYGAIMGWVKANHGFGYTEEQISAVQTRTLVVNGKDDMVVPIDHAYLFLRLLENSYGFLIPHCRHWAMIEYPQLFSQVTLDFLDGWGV
jgi:pimeloyl-ACP methyl ester carboxylesterase